MNKIIIGATIAIMSWLLGANLASRFENRATQVAQTPEEPQTSPARKAPEIAPPARKSPTPVPTARKPREPEKPTEELIEWPPIAQVNDYKDHVEYELPVLADLVEFCQLKRTFRWDRDTIVKRQIAQNVDKDSLIRGGDMPPIFPFRSRVIAMRRELETVQKHAKIGEDPEQPNPWTHPYFDKTEIPAEAIEGEAYCYYIYDVQGWPDFNEQVDKIIKQRDSHLTSNVLKLDNRIRGHNTQSYWEMWWIEHQYYHDLKIIHINLMSLRQRVRNIPKGFVRVNRGFGRAVGVTRYDYKMPVEFDEFIEQEAGIMDAQLKIVEALMHGSR